MLLFLTFLMMTLMANAPFFMALMIMCLTASVSLILGTLWSKWLGLAMFLIFVGGMMVVFLYVSSLAPNTKIQLKSTSAIIFMAPLAIFFSLNTHPSYFSFTGSMYLFTSFPLLIFLIFYLLLILFSVVKMTEKFKGSILHSSTFEWKKAFNFQQ